MKRSGSNSQNKQIKQVSESEIHSAKVLSPGKKVDQYHLQHLSGKEPEFPSG